MIEEKMDKLKTENMQKYGLNFENVQGSKCYKYYFNVDLKFILKARLHILFKVFEESTSHSKEQSGLKYKCDKCEYGRVKKDISELEANSQKFQCKYCSSTLILSEDYNKLNEEEQKVCKNQIIKLQENLKNFDAYIIPANFFGPGKL